MTAVAEPLTPPAAASAPLRVRLRSMMYLLGPHRRLIFAAIAAGAGHQLLLLASAGTGAWLVAQAATGASASALTTGLIVLAVLIVPLALMTLADTYFAHIAAFRALADVRGEVYTAFERLAPGYMLERRSGDLGSAAIGDVEQIELFFAHTLSPLAVAATVPLATVIALVAFHWALALAFVPFLILLATVPSWLRRRAEVQGRELRAALGDLSSEVIDTFQGLRELVSFGGQRRRLALLRARGATLRASKVAHGRRAGLELAATDTITIAGVLAVLITGAVLVTTGSLDRSWFPVAVVIAAVSLLPVIKVTDVARDLNMVAAAADRITTILRAPAPVTDLVEAPPPGPIEPRIGFEEVSFRYRPTLRAAVDQVSFAVAPGETVALVGHSGAGKSTCASLLLRLWDAEAGAIRIGGHDVRAFPQEELRRLLTLVPQDAFLFNISLRENIRLGRPDATDAQVEQAARDALADEFISHLPDGYDTIAGELGARMSGGQRQRIAIARALLKNAPILIMDEAVSNLDAASEREVAAAMTRAREGRTTLVIAHRLSTIQAADRIVVLHDGHVAETGTHHQLIAAQGPYVNLLASQLDTDSIPIPRGEAAPDRTPAQED
ncbi:MAG: ABC transporter ATP-binding protein [Pseudonocardiaceae bacterium]